MESTDIVIIGGGVLGGAVAFYLAKQNAGRVIVLERDLCAQGNSSLAAGLLTSGRFKRHLIPMVLETYQAIDEIEQITGSSLGMRQTGCLYATVSPENQKEIQELALISSQAGLKVERLDSSDAAHLIPWLQLPGDSSILFMPDDGYIDGYTLASGYLKSGMQMGVDVREQTSVLSICRKGDRITGVRTSKGDISSAIVIDAAGIWAGLLASEIGVALPMAPVRSHYWITAMHRSISDNQPFLILPDAHAYARPESNRLLFGFRESRSVSVDPRQLPENMTGYTFNQDPNGWESLLEGMPDFGKFIPLAEELEISNYIRGLSNYTPDGNFALGGFPALEGFLAATGCAGAGIAMSGGIGRLMADLVSGSVPFVDPSPHRIDRFGEIDPFDSDFIQRCADARSGKLTG